MPKAPYLPIFTGTGDQAICQVVEKLKRKNVTLSPQKVASFDNVRWPFSRGSNHGALHVMAYHLQWSPALRPPR